MATTIQEYAKSKKVRIHQAKAVIKAVLGEVPDTLTNEDIERIESANQAPSLPPQEDRKVLSQAQSEPEQIQQPKESQPEESQPQDQMTTAIQTTQSTQQASQPVLSGSDLETIKTLRQYGGENAVQNFLQQKRQNLIVDKAASDAIKQYDERKLYEDTRLRVENELTIRDLIEQGHSLTSSMTSHTQNLNRIKEQNKKRDEAFDLQVAQLSTLQAENIAMLESLGLTLI